MEARKAEAEVEMEMGTAKETDTPDTSNWQKVVRLIQTDFCDSQMAEQANWQVVVLNMKGGGKLFVIVLVEVLWKMVAVIINCRLGDSITLHDVLHGLQAGCRMGTSSIEAKLLHQLTSMRKEVMYTIFFTCKNRMTPWTGTDAWILWMDMEWYRGHTVS